ncbi:FdhF/YdeP family oxidoreductase [Cerasicoccus fimbriatus]|uniref:FdhF/YdeP family oxidoreductase n=1 Tax=Cerasicoccus fimbriatus TaxID=3014554 RepID=UPI0022B46FF2|nr:FdhF/YdeP family oxidoreductase [Cerasicoccus sp. TK19100]
MPSDSNQRCPETLEHLTKSDPAQTAGGVKAVANSLKHIQREAGLVHGAKALLKLNQKDGFDCPSCAWPDPDGHRASAEFCENGAKAIASETTRKRITPDFFRAHSVEALAAQTDHWHELQGRLTEPMHLPAGASHYEPISWQAAFDLIGRELNALPTPDDAIFYTSGRASNEAAFLYQLFARHFGTNNLPDCSNMCHESSGVALGSTIGIGKGTVKLEDFYEADVVLIFGQNPGTNHPRMLSALQQCVRNGGKVVAVNPLKEAGLLGFSHPQEVKGMLGARTPLASHYLQVKPAGDHALLLALAKSLVGQGAVAADFIEKSTTGFAAYREQLAALDWPTLEAQSGIERAQIEAVATLLASTEKIITCWAMGLTQHKRAVATIQEIVNLHLLRGALGKPHAGLCPVRGHSNVQGDRTMGIFEKMPDSFLDRIEQVFGFAPPRKHGHDTVDAIRAMHAEPGKVFIGLGGNFLSATPDTDFTAQALRNCRLTVHVSTKLNRSHLVTGQQALILPCLGRSELDAPRGQPQFLTVENSMGVVHASRGKFPPASAHLMSEPAIVAGIAQATLGERTQLPWAEWAEDYAQLRDVIEKTIPGFNRYNERAAQPGGFYLPNHAREGDFSKLGGHVPFSLNRLESQPLEPGQYLLMTIRSHDQFNTTVYGMDDRYRGIAGERRILLMNPDDMAAAGLQPEQPVDITSHHRGQTRTARLFLAIPYDMPRACVAAYFPEANLLVPIDSTAEKSNTPTSKGVVVTVAAAQQGQPAGII